MDISLNSDNYPGKIFKMDKTTITLALVLLANLTSFSEGLRCYRCKNTVSGTYFGYEEDASCKWGSKPDEKFLQECDSTLHENTFDFICAEIRVDGKYSDTSKGSFVGTIRDCGVRLLGTSNQQQNSTKAKELISECHQGRLDSMINDESFKNPTSKEFLVSISAIFDPSKTSAKFCSCNMNACWEEQQLPDDPTTTTSTTSTTEGGNGNKGGTSGIKSTFQLIFSVFVLLKVFFRF